MKRYIVKGDEKHFFLDLTGRWQVSIWKDGKLIDTRDATEEEIKELED